MKVSAIGNFHLHWYAHHWIGLQQALRDLPDVQLQVLDWRKSTEPRILAQLTDFRPDVVLICVMDALTDSVLDRAKEWGAFTALWFCDLRKPEPRELTGRLDLLAMTGQGWLADYARAWGLRAEQTMWLPQGCLALEELPPADPDWACDILHIGSEGHPEFHRERRAVFSELRSRFGTRFRCLNPGGLEEQADITAEMPNLYRNAAVSVGVSYPDCAGYHSNRLFLATGNGAFYVCNYFAGLSGLFDPEREVIAWDDEWEDPEAAESFADVVHARLTTMYEEEREKVRQAAFRRAQAHHTYEKRVALLWQCIQERS